MPFIPAPQLKDGDQNKVLLTNMPKDGDAPSLWYPPFFLDFSTFRQGQTALTGTTGYVAYRADNPFNYNALHVPIATESMKHYNIPSVLSGLMITKSGGGIDISAGRVRYYAGQDWKEVDIPAKTVAVGAPPPPSNPGDPAVAVQSLYVVAYDLDTAPKIDVYSPEEDLFDAAPNAATVDPLEPAIILGRIDIATDGSIIEVFNSGIHAGFASTKITDLREVIGIVQHNIEPEFTADGTGLTYKSLPNRYILNYINFGQNYQYNKFPFIGIYFEDSPYTIETFMLKAVHTAFAGMSTDITGFNWKTADPTSTGSSHTLTGNEYAFHLIYCYAVVNPTTFKNELKYCILQAQTVFTSSKAITASNPQPKIIQAELEEAVGNAFKPGFIEDFCALCGVVLVTALTETSPMKNAFIIPTSQGLSSIQEMPGTLERPHGQSTGLLYTKDGKTVTPNALKAEQDGSIYYKQNGQFTAISAATIYNTQLSFTNDPNKSDYGWNQDGAISATDLAEIKKELVANVLLKAVENAYGMLQFRNERNSLYTDGLLQAPIGEWFNVILKNTATISNIYEKLFGTGTTAQNIADGLVHFNVRLTTAQPDWDYTNASGTDFNGIQSVDFLHNLFLYTNFKTIKLASIGVKINTSGLDTYERRMPYIQFSNDNINTYTSSIDFVSTNKGNTSTTVSKLFNIKILNPAFSTRTFGFGNSTAYSLDGFGKAFVQFPEIPYTTEHLTHNFETTISQGSGGTNLDMNTHYNDDKYYSYSNNQRFFATVIFAPTRTIALDTDMSTLPKLVGADFKNNPRDNDIGVGFMKTNTGLAGTSYFLFPNQSGSNQDINFKLFKDSNLTKYAIKYRLDIEIYAI